MLELGIAEVEAGGPAVRTGSAGGLLHHRGRHGHLSRCSQPAFCWVTGAVIAIWRRERLAPSMNPASGRNARSGASSNEPPTSIPATRCDVAAAAGTQHRTGPAPPPDLRRQAVRDQRHDHAGSARTRRATPHGRARCREAPDPAPRSVRICHGVRPCREGAASPGGATLAGGWRNRLLTRRKANALPLSGAP